MANRAKRGVWQLAMDTEDCIGDASEYAARLIRIWPVPPTAVADAEKLVRKTERFEKDLARFRTGLQNFLTEQDDNRPPPAARGRVRARKAA